MSEVNSPAPRPLLARPEAWLLAIVFLALLFAYREEVPRDPDIVMDPARGYRATADLLVERGCLQLVEPPEGKGRPKIAYRLHDGCPSSAVFDAYRRLSPLGGDMASLLEQKWLIERSVDGPKLTGIRGNARQLRFADDVNLSWTDSVYYAEGPIASQRRGSTPNWLWVSGEDIISGKVPPCDGTMTVDGKPAAGPSLLYQYVQCNGRAWQSVEPIGALSEVSGSARRVRDPALASVLRRLEVPDMDGHFRTTIQSRLQRAMQFRLEGHLYPADTRNKKERTVRAGILLMDGLTGEIAAAATYPLSARHVRREERRLPWTKLNWNFERLPVGSTAKVPFAAAIIQANRDLAGTSPPASSIATDFCAKDKSGATCRRLAKADVGIGFERFVTVSSNGHALWLLNQARRSGNAAWMDNLRRFACVEPLHEDRDPTCSGHLWRSDKPSANLHTRGMAEPLLWLDMDDLRGEPRFAAIYLSILGGNRSSWTSANLAQAYARIFSDKAVNPRLTKNDAPIIPGLGIDVPVWRLVRDGMAGVLADEDGTGHDLCAALRCTDNRIGDIWLYAKTGTSNIADVAPSDRAEVGDNGKVLVLLAVRTANNAAPQRPSDIASLKLVVITQRYSAPRRNALDLAAQLFCEGQFRLWLGWGTSPAPAACRKRISTRQAA